jgi:LuxR family maltose regulon positive regulatory protein
LNSVTPVHRVPRRWEAYDSSVTDDPHPAPTAVVLDELLLDAKLSVPRPRSGVVSRAALIEEARASECRVVGVTAPAGYGKSTLLVEWAQVEDRRVAWVSLDRFDDDPAVLVTLLASAYARTSSGNDDLVADVSGIGVSVLGRAAPRLASAFRTSSEPFVLMLDDLHELRSPACHDVLEVAISGIPRDSQVVAASRSDQPHLPRLRAAGDAVEFGASDLALDAAGAEQIFSQAHVSLTRELAAAVTERTEGWPVGLYLAALIASDSKGETVTISGDDRYVADYLYRESLLQSPESTQRFLRRTAVVDQFCAPLCDALLGEAGSQERLRGLEASSLFLILLDRRREWFRYHALFREFLLGELRRVEPEVIPKLHLRAADWYESNGSPTLALEHLLNTAERDRCVQLVTALTLPTYLAGQMSTIQRWLAAVGDEAIAGYPPLAVMAGWIAALSGQTAEAQRWAAVIDAASFDLVPLDGSASFESARALLRTAMCPAGPEQMMIDASLAVSQAAVECLA